MFLLLNSILDFIATDHHMDVWFVKCRFYFLRVLFFQMEVPLFVLFLRV